MFNVLIVGCGNIAGGFDLGRLIDAPPFTHAGALSRHPSFRITACVEPNSDRRQAFMNAWSVPVGYPTLNEALAAARYDVICICSPTRNHASDLEEALHAFPRIVFCEKPLTGELLSSEKLVAAYAEAGVPLVVNYSRRFDPQVRKVKADLASGDWGKIRSASALYNKGVLNNGSHMVDLLHQIFGPLSIRCVGRPVLDHTEQDPSIPALFETSNAIPVTMNCGHAGDYALFELQIVTEKGVVTMEEGGLRWRLRHAGPSSTFAGYTVLSDSLEVPGGIGHAMRAAIDEIAIHLETGADLSSSGQNALEVQRICETLVRKSVHAVE